MAEDTLGRNLAKLEAEVEGHDGWITKLESNIQAIGAAQAQDTKELLEAIQEIKLQLAERKGVEKLAYLLMGGIGVVATIIVENGIKRIF